MRAIVDSVAHETYRASVIVGIWEGVVLNHFLAKYPTSVDPYVAFAFRLVVDYIYTQSMSRMVIILLWTGLGMLLSDVAVEMSVDRRIRRFWRRFVRQSRSSRVRFEPANTAGTRNTAARVPPPPASAIRPTTHPVPGQFDQFSLVSVPTVTVDSPPSSTRSVRLMLSPTNLPLPHSPSELSYVDGPLPVIADSHDDIDLDPRRQTLPPRSGIIYNPDDVDAPSIHSGLTTPVNDPISLSHTDRPRVHSGLTTPENLNASMHPHTPGLPPVDVYDVDDQPLAELSGGPAVPIRLTLAEPSPHAPSMPIPEPLLPPAYEVPTIPTPHDEATRELGATSRTPPPSFVEATRDPQIEDGLESPAAESVISTSNVKSALIAKADDLRKQADAKEKEVHTITAEMRRARAERRPFDALRLEVELLEAKEAAAELHAKAKRRFHLGGFSLTYDE